LETSVSFVTVDDAVRFIKPSSYLAKLDLSAAYRSIPIRKENYQLTGLQWRFSELNSTVNLFDSRLPFGAAMSCAIFQRITDSIARIMYRKGFIVLCYIDDMLCVGESELECQLCLDTLVSLVESLGLVINWSKVCAPTRKLTFLGVVLDCDSRTLALPTEKVIELKATLFKWRFLKKVTKLQLQKICGKLNWASRVVRGGRTFTRRLLDLLTGLKESHHHVRLNSLAREDLIWWENCFDQFHGFTPFAVDIPLPNFTFSTDACERGGGAYFQNDWLYVSWEQDCPQMKSRHITELELYIVFLALCRWGPSLRNCHVLIRSDCVAAVSALNKSTSRSKNLMPIIREIFWLAVKYNITVSSAHIPGKLNILSDRISRMDNRICAFDARVMLAGFKPSLVFCKSHMSYATFVWLQAVWLASLLNYV
jgi:hypothetical protein